MYQSGLIKIAKLHFRLNFNYKLRQDYFSYVLIKDIYNIVVIIISLNGRFCT